MERMKRSEVREHVIEILSEIRDDSHCSTMVTEDTRLFADLGLESIDVVALGSALEQYFDQSFSYAEFLSRARQQQWADITVDQLLTFLVSSLNAATMVHR